MHAPDRRGAPVQGGTVHRPLSAFAIAVVAVVAVVAVLAVVAGTAAAHPAAAAPPSVTAESDLAVRDLAAERGIDLAEAARRIGWQRQAPQLSRQARAELGEAAFGGLWITLDGSDRVKLGVVGSDHTPARRLVAASAVAGAVDVVPVRYPMTELERVNGWLGAELARVNRNAEATLTAGLRP